MGGGGPNLAIVQDKTEASRNRLSGGKASEDSFTPRRCDLAVVDAVDCRFDLFSFAALGLSCLARGTF